MRPGGGGGRVELGAERGPGAGGVRVDERDDAEPGAEDPGAESESVSVWAWLRGEMRRDLEKVKGDLLLESDALERASDGPVVRNSNRT